MTVVKRIILFLLISFSAFGFRLEGITYNKSLENGYREYKVHNDGLKKVRYKISIHPSGEDDISKSLQVFPKIITIEPKSSQVFKLFGNNKGKLENKEYKFILKFEPIVIPTLVKGEDGKTSGSTSVPLAPSVQMKGYGGIIDFSEALELRKIEFSKNEKKELVFNGELFNNSHGTIELAMKFSNKNENRVDSDAIGSIGPGQSKKLKIVIDVFTDESQIKYIDFYDDGLNTVKRIIRE